MKYIYLVLMLTSVIFADNVSQAIEEAKQAEKQFMQGLKSNDKEVIKNAYELAKQAQKNDVSNLRINQLYYGIGVARVSLFREKNIIDEIKNVFPNLRMANVNVAPPSYLDGLFLDKNETKKKIKLFKKAIDENIKFPKSYFELADNYMKLERYNLAIDILNRGMKNTGLSQLEFHYSLVFAYMSQSYYLEGKLICIANNNTLTKKIIKEAKEVLKFNPNITEMYGMLAKSYERMGRFTLALDAARKNFDKNSSEESLVLYEEFLINDGMKEEYFKRKSKKENSESLINLGNAYFMNQDWKLASNYYKKEIDEEKESVYFYIYLKYAVSSGLAYGEETKKSILKNIPKDIIKNNWQKSLVNLFLNNINAKTLLKKADNSCKRTETYFWVGMSYLKSDSRKAIEFFQKVLDEKVYAYVEYAASKYYINEGIKEQ